MALPFLALITIFPALLVLLVGVWVVRIFRKQDRSLGWLFYLLFVVPALVLPIIVGSFSIRTGGIGFLTLVLLPALIGTLAILFYHIRDLFKLWLRMKVLVSALLMGMFFLIVLTAIGELFLPLIIVLPALLLAVLYGIFTRISKTAMVVVSALVLGVLFLDAMGLISNHTVVSNDYTRAAYNVFYMLLPALVFPLAAALAQRGLETSKDEESMDIYLYFALAAGLVFMLAAGIFRYGVLVEATGHAFEDRLPFSHLLFAVAVGMLLLFTLHLIHRTAAGVIIMFLIPAALMVAYTAGSLLDPYAITVARAQRIEGAIEEYRMMANLYPSDVGELVPNYMLYLPPPLTGRGAVWCYQGGQDYYRLGFVNYKRYYSRGFLDPFSEIVELSSQGEPPTESWMCDQELELIKRTGGL